jgi:hypothetical protein
VADFTFTMDDDDDQMVFDFQPYARPALIGIVAGRMGAGKTTVSQRLIAEHGYTKVSLAGPLKFAVKAFLSATGFHPDEVQEMIYGSRKETPIALLGNKSPREMMQTLGTDWGRNMVDENIWINQTEPYINDYINRGNPVVVDDIRFQNEVDMIRRCGGFIIYVDRNDDEDYLNLPANVVNHVSEGDVSFLDAHYVIANNGTVEELIQETDRALDFLSAPLTETTTH